MSETYTILEDIYQNIDKTDIGTYKSFVSLPESIDQHDRSIKNYMLVRAPQWEK